MMQEVNEGLEVLTRLHKAEARAKAEHTREAALELHAALKAAMDYLKRQGWIVKARRDD